jgi:uncharacterized protein YrrD
MNTDSPNQNLIKGKDLIGLKVVTLQKGQMVDDVDEIVYDHAEDQVKALVVDSGGWFNDAKVILFEDIKSIGRDAVIIESEAVIRKASEVAGKISRIIKGDNYLTANKIITEDGNDLGQVSDIYFDPQTGKVVELEVSQGAIKNAQSGKKRIQMGDIVNVGEDATIVSSNVEQSIENQAQYQGLKGGLATAQNDAPGVIYQTKQKLSDFGQTVKQKVQEIKEDPKTQETVDTIKTKATQAKDSLQQKAGEGKQKFDDKAWKNALGKYVTVNILSTNDEILARRGDMITNELLSLAEAEGMLDKVVSNTSPKPVNSFDDKA